jgi:hypothetical protein
MVPHAIDRLAENASTEPGSTGEVVAQVDASL